MWNCCQPSESLSSIPLRPSRCVLRVSTREMVICLIPWVARSSRRSILLEFSFLLVVMLDGVLRARRRDKDEDQINALRKCTLDRENYTSLCSPFTLPYAWISGRDFCLVGVSCHIPNSSLTYASFHVSIVFKFKWNLNWGIFKSLRKPLKITNI